MKRNTNWYFIILGLLLGLMAALALLAATNYPAYAVAPASPRGSTLLNVSGDLELSEQPIDIRVAECLRVNVPRIGSDGAWAYLTLPRAAAGIQAVALFDGWHLLHGKWEQINDFTLRLHFSREDLLRLDGTVGLYLLIIAE